MTRCLREHVCAQVNTSSSDAQLASIGKTEMFENDENMKLYLDLFAGDDVTEDVLAALEDSTSPDGVTSTLTAEDMARLDALLAEEVRQCQVQLQHRAGAQCSTRHA